MLTVEYTRLSSIVENGPNGLCRLPTATVDDFQLSPGAFSLQHNRMMSCDSRFL